MKVCNKYSNIARHKKQQQKTKRKNAQLTKHDAFLYWSSSCPMWWWATARKLGRCYSGLFHVGGLLAAEKQKQQQKTKQKQKTLNSPNMMPFFTGPLPVQCGGRRRPGSLADATQDCSTSEDFSPRTVLTKNICRCGHHILQHFTTTTPFLTVSAITYSWMASTAPQADSW